MRGRKALAKGRIVTWWRNSDACNGSRALILQAVTRGLVFPVSDEHRRVNALASCQTIVIGR